MTLQDLLDKQELYELLVRYCRALDRADEALLRSTYHPDAIGEHGRFKGTMDAFIVYLRGGVLDPEIQREPMQMAVTNALFELHGDVAYGEAYVETRRYRDGELSRSMGRFVDRYERRDGTWRIAHRRVILESPAIGYDTADFVPWARDRSDPSYERGSVSSKLSSAADSALP